MSNVTHQIAKTQYVQHGDITYAYRRFGALSKSPPVVLLMHFRGTMDMWDPLLINSLAAHRTVILFDNAGVGQSGGTVARTGTEMAGHVISFLAALQLHGVDVFGFSMGGLVAPLVHLNGPPGLVRKLIIAGSGVSYGEDVPRHSEVRQTEVGALAGGATSTYDNAFGTLFFGPSATSQAAGRAWYARAFERNLSTSGEERSKLVSEDYVDGGEGVKNLSAVLQWFSDPANRAEGTYDRLVDITIPVFVGQGSDDFMIPTVQSFLLQQKLPDARLKLFPNSGHGFLYQYAEEFAEDVTRFLDL